MNTKKLFSMIIMLVLVFCSSLTISSCNKDDKNEESTNKEYNLIGTWKYTFDSPSDYVLLTFNVDGTGKSVEFDDGEIDDDETFRYSYAENILTVYYEDGYKEKIIINWQSKNKFITSWYDSVDVWIRQ